MWGAGVQDRQQGFPRRGEVGYVHFSPPCQKISRVCATRCVSAYLRDLVPRLTEVTPFLQAWTWTLRVSVRSAAFWHIL